jgi:hypothetical protein
MAHPLLPPRQNVEMWTNELLYGALPVLAPDVVPAPPPPSRPLWTVDAIARRRAVRDMMPEPTARALHGWVWSEPALEALRTTIAELKRRSYRVVVLVTPSHSRYLAVLAGLPDGPSIDQRFRTAVLAPGVTGADTVLVLGDAAAIGGSDSVFVDYGHLTRRGAELQTHRIAEFLRAWQPALASTGATRPAVAARR